MSEPNTPNVTQQHPTRNAIIESGGFQYLYLGSYHDHAKSKGIEPQDLIDSGAGMVMGYDPTSPDYMYVRAVYCYQGKYHYVPSSFSSVGTLDPQRAWKVLVPSLGYSVMTMSREICATECPGYLDVFA